MQDVLGNERLVDAAVPVRLEFLYALPIDKLHDGGGPLERTDDLHAKNGHVDVWCQANHSGDQNKDSYRLRSSSIGCQLEKAMAPTRVVPSEIKNKLKRTQVYREQKAEKKKEARVERKKRQKETAELGDQVRPTLFDRSLAPKPRLTPRSFSGPSEEGSANVGKCPRIRRDHRRPK